MLERLVRIPLIWSLLAMALAAAYFLRPIDRSALFPVRYCDNRMGYVNAEGRVALAGPWDDADPFDSSGFAIVQKGSEPTMIDPFGRVFMEGEYISGFDSSGLGRVKRDGKWAFFDRTGELVILADWDGPFDFQESGLARVERNHKFGCIDRTGRLAIPAEWDDVSRWHTKSFPIAVKRGDKWGFVDHAGKLVIPLDWDIAVAGFDRSGTAAVKKGDKWGFIDVDGRVVIPLEWDTAFGFEDSDRALVGRAGKVGFIDRSGKVVIPVEWDDGSPFDESGLASVLKSGKRGYIDRTGDVAIPLEWDRAYPFGDSDFATVVSTADKWGVIDRKGRMVLPTRFGQVDILRAAGTGIERFRTFDWLPEEPRAGWMDSLRKLAEKIGWKEPNRVLVSELYDTDGRLVWSSDGLSERSWMVLAGIAISLLIIVEVGWLVSRQRGSP